LKVYTKNTIESVRSLAAECRNFREKGFATDESEYLDGVRCLAAPIRDRDGAVIASIGISAPAARFPREREREFAGMVVAVAAEIGELIGSLED
jgi:IclR family acetate operon transcriptional repressor